MLKPLIDLSRCCVCLSFCVVTTCDVAKSSAFQAPPPQTLDQDRTKPPHSGNRVDTVAPYCPDFPILNARKEERISWLCVGGPVPTTLLLLATQKSPEQLAKDVREELLKKHNPWTKPDSPVKLEVTSAPDGYWMCILRGRAGIEPESLSAFFLEFITLRSQQQPKVVAVLKAYSGSKRAETLVLYPELSQADENQRIELQDTTLGAAK